MLSISWERDYIIRVLNTINRLHNYFFLIPQTRRIQDQMSTAGHFSFLLEAHGALVLSVRENNTFILVTLHGTRIHFRCSAFEVLPLGLTVMSLRAMTPSHKPKKRQESSPSSKEQGHEQGCFYCFSHPPPAHHT